MALRATLAAVLLFAAFGCRGREASEAAVTTAVADSGGVSVVMITGSPADVPSWTLTPSALLEVDGNAPPYLGSLGAVALLSDGRLVASDNQTQRLFLVESGEVRPIGGAGDGPGEFRNLVSLRALRGDTFVAFDRDHGRLTTFDARGALVSTLTVGEDLATEGALVQDAWAFEPSRFLLHVIGPPDPGRVSGPIQRDRRDALLYLVEGGERNATPGARFVGGYEITRESIRLLAPFSNVPAVAASSERALYGSGIEFELTLASAHLEPVRRIRWPGWRRPLTDSVKGSVQAAIEAMFAGLPARSPLSASRTLEAVFAEPVLPDSLPALGSVFFDDTGQLWISQFVPPTNVWDYRETWVVLDRQGGPIGRLTLPPGSRLAGVRGDRAALVVRDAFDVQHLRVHGVDRPAPR